MTGEKHALHSVVVWGTSVAQVRSR